jgi:hypothetical protein
MIIILIILLISIILNIILFIRGMKLVGDVEKLTDSVLEAEKIVDDSQSTLEKMLEEMRAIDIRGSFEADDEVGSVFTQLKALIQKYKN